MAGKLIELKEQLNSGQISRREFTRAIALLGVTLGAGEILAACSPSPDADNHSNSNISFRG